MPYSKLRMQIYKDLHTNLKNTSKLDTAIATIKLQLQCKLLIETTDIQKEKKLFPASILGKVLAWK